MNYTAFVKTKDSMTTEFEYFQRMIANSKEHRKQFFCELSVLRGQDK